MPSSASRRRPVFVEDEICRHVDERREIFVDLLGFADHPDIGMKLAHHPLQPPFRRMAETAFGLADSDDTDFVFPAIFQQFPELHELPPAGASPTGEKDNKNRFTVKQLAVNTWSADGFRGD